MRTCKIGYLNGARACSTQLKIIMNSDYIKLADIAYEQIDGNFWYGSYGVFRVVIMKDCGFINASRLCDNGGKELKYWYANQGSKDLLQCLAAKLGESSIDCVVIRKLVKTFNQTDIEKTISGTYYHPLIIPHIACWVSAEYALRVSEIVIDFHVGEYKSRLNEEQTRRQHAEEWARQEKAGREATTQIWQVTEQQNEIMKRELAYADEEVREKDRVLEDKNVEMMEKDKALDDQNVEIARQSAELAVACMNLLTTKNKLVGAKCKIIKSKTNLFLWSCTHSFVIMKVNDENARGAYYVIRTRRRTIRAAMKRFTNKHPNATIMIEQRFIPNGVNLYQRLKVQRLIKTHHNFFNIMTCEHGLVKAIDAMNANESRPPVVNYSDPCC